jgi:hypothetical protein
MTVNPQNTFNTNEPDWIPRHYLIPRDVDTLIGRMAASNLVDVDRPLKGFDNMEGCEISMISDKIKDLKTIISLNADPVLIKNLKILQNTLLPTLKAFALKLHGQGYEALSAESWMDQVIDDDSIDFERKCQVLMNPRLLGKQLKPLMEIVLESNKLDKLRTLLKLGANIPETNPYMVLPAIILPSKAEIIRELLNNEASVHDRDDSGNTALHWSRTAEVAEALLKAGADPSAKGYCNRTPLHNVTRVKTAQLLIDAGADLTIRDFMGESPLDRAEKLGLKLRPFRDIALVLRPKTLRSML